MQWIYKTRSILLSHAVLPRHLLWSGGSTRLFCRVARMGLLSTSMTQDCQVTRQWRIDLSDHTLELCYRGGYVKKVSGKVLVFKRHRSFFHNILAEVSRQLSPAWGFFFFGNKSATLESTVYPELVSYAIDVPTNVQSCKTLRTLLTLPLLGQLDRSHCNISMAVVRDGLEEGPPRACGGLLARSLIYSLLRILRSSDK